MSVYEKGLITVLGVNALLALIAAPLVRRKIPPNGLYGYRTRATLSDTELWYAANAHFGRRLLWAAFIGAAAAAVVYLWGDLSPQGFLRASMLLLVVPSGVAALLTHFFVRAWLRDHPPAVRRAR